VSCSQGDVGARELPNVPAALDPTGFEVIHDSGAMDSKSARKCVDGQPADIVFDEVVKDCCRQPSLDGV
jgi:hypothetical protein